MKLFQKQQILGIDLSDYSLEVLVINKSEELWEARTLIPEGLIENGKILQVEEVAEKLKVLLRKLEDEHGVSFNGWSVAASLPESKTYIYCFDVTADKEQALIEEIRQKVEKVLPMDLNALRWDYQVKKQGDTKRAVFVAAPTDIISDYKKLFNLLDLNLTVLDAESLAIGRALLGHEHKEKTLIIDIGHRSADMSFFGESNNLELAASIGVGGKQLAKALMEGLKISRQEANEIKKTIGLSDKSNEAYDILADRLAPVIKAINQALAYYETKSNGPVSNIILAGGTALMPGLGDFLFKQLGRKVTVGRLLRRVDNPKAQPILFANALGLALLVKSKHCQGVNLLKSPLGSKSSDDDSKPSLTISGKNPPKKWLVLTFFVSSFVFLGVTIYNQIYQPYMINVNKLEVGKITKEEQAIVDNQPSQNIVTESNTPVVSSSATSTIAVSSTVDNIDILSSSTTSSLALSTSSVNSAIIMVEVSQTPTGWLNVRDQPSRNGKILKKINVGDRFELLEEGPEWCKIKIDKDTVGWVSSQYLKK